MNFNKKFILRVLPTLLAFNLVIGLCNIDAHAATGSQTVTFSESSSSVGSKVITIPNLRNVTSVTVNTGSVNYSVSGNDITINVSGGSPSRTVWNATKYSISATKTITQRSNNTFASTTSYSDANGYSGTLPLSGSSWATLVSGTAAASIYATGSSSSTSNSFSGTYYYNDGTYSGYLGTNGASYVSSGSYTAAWNEKVYNGTSGGYFSWWSTDGVNLDASAPSKYPTKWCGGSTANGNPVQPADFPTYWDAYTTYWAAAKVWSSTHACYTRKCYVGYKHFYWVYHPAIDTRVYTQNYAGTANKPDTRIWDYHQNYAGTAYKGANDYYYSYNVTVNYTSNIIPAISLSTPVSNDIYSPSRNITISGTVNDGDIGDILKIYYRFDSGAATQLGSDITANAANQAFSGSASVSTLTEGVHTLYTYVLDSFGEKSIEISRTFTVSTKVPTGTFNPFSSTWSNQSKIITFDPSDNSGSGINYWVYRTSSDNGASYGPWSAQIIGDVSSTITFSTDGIWKLNVNVYDNTNMLGDLTSGTYCIDKTLPSANITVPGFVSNSSATVPVSFSGIADNLSGVTKITASLYSDYNTNAVIATNPGANVILNVAREKFYNNATIYAQVQDAAGNIKRYTITTFLEPYKPNPPTFNTLNNDGLLVKNEPINVSWNYSDPTDLPQSKAIIDFIETSTQDKYSYTVTGTKTSMTLLPNLPQGTYNLTVTVYNSANKASMSTILLRQEHYKSDGIVYTKTINSKGTPIGYVNIVTNSENQTNTTIVNGIKNVLTTDIKGYIVLPDNNGIYDDNPSNITNSKIPFKITGDTNNIPIKLPRKVSELKILLKLSTEDENITPILSNISIYAR